MPATTHTRHPRSIVPAALAVAVCAALVAASMVAASAAPRAALAAGSYNGGADDAPAYIANDHTPVAIHFVASGLEATTAYYLKVRFCVGSAPSGNTNRGWTWNAATPGWTQERDDWANFPQITTDASGNIGSSAGWVFAKFGDTRQSGTYYVLISLSKTGSADTLNPDTTVPDPLTPTVTVLDMTAGGLWVHGGIASGAQAAKRAEAVDAATGLSVLALQKTESNGCDDDSDGVVDNETYGLGGGTGGFRFAIPTSTSVNVLLNRNPWAPGQGASGTTADVDIALGATDTTPPTAVTGLQATAGDAEVDLQWDESTDNVDDPGDLAYGVWRWTDATPIGGATQYTPVLEKLGSTNETSWNDTTVDNGTTYHYLVRAVDSATNTGPRSDTVDATPLAPTTMTMTAAPSIVNYKRSALLTGTLESSGAELAGADVIVESSPDDTAWTTVTTVTSASGTYLLTINPTVKLHYRMHFAGDATHQESVSEDRIITPRAWVTRPLAPKTVRASVRFTVSGSLKPHHAAGKRSVVIRCYRKQNGKWVLRKSVRATNLDYSSYTKYRVRFALPYRGSWRLQAFAPADADHAAKASSYRYVSVT